MMICSAVLLLTLAIAQESSAGESTELAHQSRSLSLRGLEPIPFDKGSVHYPMSPFHTAQDDGFWAQVELPEPDYDELVEFLVAASFEEYQEAGASIEVEGNSLVLQGPQELLDRYERLIHYWRTEVNKPTSVRILRGAPGAMKVAYQMQLIGSAPSEVRRTHQMPITSGFDLNVASRAASFAPITRQLLIGDVQVATADPYIDGVHVSWLTRTSSWVRSLGRQSQIRTQLSTDTSNAVEFQRVSIPDPILLVRSVATSAGLTVQGGLEIETTGRMPGDISWSEVNRMESSGPPPAAIHVLDALAESPLALFAVGSLARNHWEIEGLLTSVRGGWPDTYEAPYWMTLQRPDFDAYYRTRDYLGGKLSIRMDRIGAFAQLNPEEAPPAERSRLLSEGLEHLRSAAKLPAQLELTLHLVRAGNEPAEILLRAPISSDSQLVATVGTERLAVIAQNSYIAEGSSITAPETAPVFQGLLVHCEPILIPGGPLLLSLSVEGRFRRGEIVTNPETGVEHENFDVLSLRERNLRLERSEDGTWSHRFGSAEDGVLSLGLTVRER